MAATIANAIGANSIVGGVSHVQLGAIDVTGDASYPTGGYAVTLATFLPAGAVVVGVLPVETASGFVPQWDATNAKLKLFNSNGASPAPLLECPNTTNVTTSVTRIYVLFLG